MIYDNPADTIERMMLGWATYKFDNEYVNNENEDTINCFCNLVTVKNKMATNNKKKKMFSD